MVFYDLKPRSYTKPTPKSNTPVFDPFVDVFQGDHIVVQHHGPDALPVVSITVRPHGVGDRGTELLGPLFLPGEQLLVVPGIVDLQLQHEQHRNPRSGMGVALKIPLLKLLPQQPGIHVLGVPLLRYAVAVAVVNPRLMDGPERGYGPDDIATTAPAHQGNTGILGLSAFRGMNARGIKPANVVLVVLVFLQPLGLRLTLAAEHLEHRTRCASAFRKAPLHPGASLRHHVLLVLLLCDRQYFPM